MREKVDQTNKQIPNMNFSWNKAMPHVVVILIFVITAAVYFSPSIGNDYDVRSHDINLHKGMSKEIVDHREKYGEEPLWTNSMFGGMPATRKTDAPPVLPDSLMGSSNSSSAMWVPSVALLSTLSFWLHSGLRSTMLCATGFALFCALPSSWLHSMTPR